MEAYEIVRVFVNKTVVPRKLERRGMVFRGVPDRTTIGR